MSQARRNRFEEQLKALQNDITNLSHKLSAPTRTTVDDSYINGSNLSPGVSVHTRSSSMAWNPMLTVNDTESPTGIAGSESGQIARLKHDLHIAIVTRDDALYKLEQVTREIEHMKATNKEAIQVRIQYDNLRKEYDALKISFESSERIRKQQKELINILQQSSSISSVALNGFDRKSINTHEIANLAAENHPWLNSHDHLAPPNGDRIGRDDNYYNNKPRASSKSKTKQKPTEQSKKNIKSSKSSMKVEKKSSTQRVCENGFHSDGDNVIPGPAKHVTVTQSPRSMTSVPKEFPSMFQRSDFQSSVLNSPALYSLPITTSNPQRYRETSTSNGSDFVDSGNSSSVSKSRSMREREASKASTRTNSTKSKSIQTTKSSTLSQGSQSNRPSSAPSRSLFHHSTKF